MRLALAQAELAYQADEVPVGAVLVSRAGEVLAAAHNRTEAAGDPTAHAELLCIRQAAAAAGGWRLLEATLYVTLEPCPMCAGALLQVSRRGGWYRLEVESSWQAARAVGAELRGSGRWPDWTSVKVSSTCAKAGKALTQSFCRPPPAFSVTSGHGGLRSSQPAAGCRWQLDCHAATPASLRA